VNLSAPRTARIEPPVWLAVLHALTWKRLTAVETMTIVLTLMQYIWARAAGAKDTTLEPQLILNSVGCWIILLAALVADELVRRGLRLCRTYATALLLASAVVALVQWQLGEALRRIPMMPDSGTPLWDIVNSAPYVCTIGGLGMMAYLQRQSSQRLLLGIRAAELERAEDERRVIESRLAATRARVDASSLLRALATIRDRYAASRPDADTALDELILELRTSIVRSKV
jgi:hypothetical protein